MRPALMFLFLKVKFYFKRSFVVRSLLTFSLNVALIYLWNESPSFFRESLLSESTRPWSVVLRSSSLCLLGGIKRVWLDLLKMLCFCPRVGVIIPYILIYFFELSLLSSLSFLSSLEAHFSLCSCSKIIWRYEQTLWNILVFSILVGTWLISLI